jgi:hypothetical protein
MLANRAQIWVLVRSLAMRSFETKLSVVPGRKCCGQLIADWVAMLMDEFVIGYGLLSFWQIWV